MTAHLLVNNRSLVRYLKDEPRMVVLTSRIEADNIVFDEVLAQRRERIVFT